MKNFLFKTFSIALAVLSLFINLSFAHNSENHPNYTTMPLEDIFDWNQEET